MSNLLGTICALSAAGLLLSSPPPKQTPDVQVPPELAGTWHVSGEIADEPGGEPNFSWEIELTLRGNTYRRQGYPPWDERATIARLEKEGRTYRLTLVEHVRNGDKIEGEVVSLVLSEDGRTLQYGGKTLRRTTPVPPAR